MNWADYDDEQLARLIIDANAEALRREAVREAPVLIDQMVRDHLTASGREMGAPWVAPTGAHNAYPEGWTAVGADGLLYRSTISANNTEPGPSARYWVREGPPEVTEWALDVYYYPDDRVTRLGGEYLCTHEHLSAIGWEPENPTMHAVWKRQA